REMEKLVLTGKQAFYKDQAAEYYGQLLHEGLAFDPAMEDLEALIASSQKRVDGEARLRLRERSFEVTGVRSPFSLMNAGATYGEGSSLWTGKEAAGFAKLHALPMVLARRMAKR
ncbi:MAG: argininosuccinate synthase, partial [Elusimicrobiota bacterium]